MEPIISVHLVRVVRFVRDHGRWVTSADIAEGAQVAARTARHHAVALAELGIFEQMAVYPGHRYRFNGDTSNPDHLARLQAAEEAFNLEPSRPSPATAAVRTRGRPRLRASPQPVR